MRILLTGATGFIGSHIVPELLGAGHRVVGLTRSDAGARALEAAGAEVHRGTLEEPDSLRAGAAACEAAIHTAFDHDFTNFAANCRKDARAIEALAAGLEGRPLVVASATGLGTAVRGEPATEDHFDADHPLPRIATEVAGRTLNEAGADVRFVRLSQIHDPHSQGLVTPMIALARATGMSAYVGTGELRWSAAHVSDTARLFRLALEHGAPRSCWHATAEEEIALRTIAEAVARRCGVPLRALGEDDAAAHFGWLAAFARRDMSASSTLTRERLGWNPTGPGLIADVDAVSEVAAPAA